MTLESAQAASPDESGSSQTYRFRFHGEGLSFFLIFLKNILLTLLTLGVYLAWAKTQRRGYVWQNLEFHGQRLGYTGTGWELFKGYLRLLLGYALFLGLPFVAGRILPWLQTALQTGLGFGLAVLIPFLIYWSRAFLYSRTTWRGIRFGLSPGAPQYAKEFLIGYFLVFVTFGLYLPVMANRLHLVLTNNTRFGSLKLAYTGSDARVFWLAVRGFVLSMLTLGLYYFWYRAQLLRFRAAHTRVGDDAWARLDVSGAGLLKLWLLNVLVTTLTLGLAFPWVAMYSIRYMADRTSIHGLIDFDRVLQRAKDGSSTADSFADAFDVGIGI